MFGHRYTNQLNEDMFACICCGLSQIGRKTLGMKMAARMAHKNYKNGVFHHADSKGHSRIKTQGMTVSKLMKDPHGWLGWCYILFLKNTVVVRPKTDLHSPVGNRDGYR